MKHIKKWANEGQQWLFERGAKPTLLVGGINSGKTVGCSLKGIGLLTEYPGSRLAVVRRSYTQLVKTTMETWYQWCLPEFYEKKGSRNESVLNFNNGSRVYFIHLDQPNSLDLLAGLELNFAYVSQVEEISEKAWDLLDVRIGRWTGAKVPPEAIMKAGGIDKWEWKSEDGDVIIPPRYLFAEGYVTDEGHWLYNRFSPDSPERAKWEKLGYESRIVFSEDNTYAVKATVEASLSKDDDYIRRYVRPQWGNPEGKIFKIDPQSILVPTPALVERILRTMKLHRSLDHGEFSPTCCGWHATDYDGNIFTYREYYKGDALVSTHRQNIFELSKEDGGKYHSNLADPTIDSNNRGRTLTSKPTWSVLDEYQDSRIMPLETVIRWSLSQNDEMATRSRMKEYLRVDANHKNPITGKMGAPHLYFLKKTPDYPNGCDHILREIGSQMRVKSKVGDREVWLDQRDDNIVDHGYDMEKYFVISRPSLGPEIKVETLAPGEMRVADYERASEAQSRFRKKLQQRRDQSGYGYGG